MNKRNFCSLTINNKRNDKLNSLFHKNSNELNYIFKDLDSKLEKLTIIEAERKRALENLRFLTHTLQKNRIKSNSNAKVLVNN